MTPITSLPSKPFASFGSARGGSSEAYTDIFPPSKSGFRPAAHESPPTWFFGNFGTAGGLNTRGLILFVRFWPCTGTMAAQAKIQGFSMVSIKSPPYLLTKDLIPLTPSAIEGPGKLNRTTPIGVATCTERFDCPNAGPVLLRRFGWDGFTFDPRNRCTVPKARYPGG